MHLVGFMIRIYHNAQSPGRQKLLLVTPNHSSPLGHPTVNILTTKAELANPCRDLLLASEEHMASVMGTVNCTSPIQSI